MERASFASLLAGACRGWDTTHGSCARVASVGADAETVLANSVYATVSAVRTGETFQNVDYFTFAIVGTQASSCDDYTKIMCVARRCGDALSQC